VTVAAPRRWSIAPAQRRAIWHGLIVAGVLFNATLVLFWMPRLDMWIDARAWWTINLADLYGPGEQSLTLIGAFRYAPVIAWLFYPATWLTWEQLVWVYVVLSGAALWFLTGRRALLFLVAFPPVLLELVNGNVHLFIALAIWVGLRWAPSGATAWAFVLFTKVTSGVGLVWFVARREWRNLAYALGATAGIALVGALLAPELWAEWIRSLSIASNVPPPAGVPPLIVRLPIAAAIAWYAGRTDRAWLVPIAAFIGLPIWWLQGTAILTASFPLYWEHERFRRGTRTTDVTPARNAALVHATEPEGRA
jgi:glycosyl transferase family 87